MKRHRRHIWNILVGLVLLAIPYVLLAQGGGDGQAGDGSGNGEDFASPISPVPFREIHLSSDGVYGVDSAGVEWDFDFSTERFVNSEEASGTTERVFRPDEELERFSSRF